MKKILKILLSVGLAFVVLCAVAVIVITVIVDPNEYKGEIAQLVRDRTGRELSFEGDIELSFVPYIGFRVGSVALGNASGFSDSEMLRVNRAEVSLRLAPLLAGKLAIGKVVLDGLSVRLVRNEQGRGNWEDLAGREEGTPVSSQAPAESSAESGASDGGFSLAAISVQGVEVTNANLVYTDLQNQSELSVGNLDLILGAIRGTDSFPFELGFDLVLDQPKLEVRPTFSGNIQLNPAAGTVTVDDLALSALGLQVNGKVHVSAQGETPTFSGTLQLAETSLRNLMDKLGMALPETADSSALEQFSATLSFAGTDDSAELKHMTVKLDDTTLTAQGAVVSFAHPRIVAAVHVDTLDVDRYLPSRNQSEPGEAGTASDASDDSSTVDEPDLSALRRLALDARLDVQSLKVMNVTATDIRVDAALHDGVLALSPLSLVLGDGRFEGGGVLDATSEVASWSGEGALEEVNVQPILNGLLGKDVLSGQLSFDYDINGSGLTPENVTKTVCGEASLSVTDGSVIGVDVAKMIRDGWNKIMGADEDGSDAGDFDFSSLTASARLKNGHLVNDDFLFDSPLVQADGAGWADLPGNSTDYRATVTVVGSLDGLEGELLETVRDIPLPVRVQGSLSQPSIGLDLEAMAELLMAAGAEAGLEILADSLLGDSEDDLPPDDAYADDSADSSNDDDGLDLLNDLF